LLGKEEAMTQDGWEIHHPDPDDLPPPHEPLSFLVVMGWGGLVFGALIGLWVLGHVLLS
jgi:hypothetical protein